MSTSSTATSGKLLRNPPSLGVRNAEPYATGADKRSSPFGLAA